MVLLTLRGHMTTTFNMKAFIVLDKLMAGLGHSDHDLA